MRDLIKNGWWEYGQNSKIIPGKHSLPMSILTPEIKNCFFRTFNNGHNNPSERVSASEWRSVLRNSLNKLKQCSNNQQC